MKKKKFNNMFEVKFLAFAACIGLLFLFDQGINCEEGKI